MKSIGNGANLFPMPVLMIATYNEDGSVDVMNMAWGGISDDHKIMLCLDPSHKTSDNIKQRMAFTVSLADYAHMKQSDYLGVVSAHQVKDKFITSGLKAERSLKVDAPVVVDYPLTLECKVVDQWEDENTHNVIGEIIDTLADESILDEKGRVDVKKLDALTFSTFDKNYYRIGEVAGKAFREGVSLIRK